MNITSNQSVVIRALAITILFVILTTCFDYIDKHISGILLSILIFVVFVTMVVYLIKGIIVIVKNRHNLSFALFLPLLIYILVPLLGSFIDLEKYKSKVVLRGCYKGTQNQAFLLFREDNTFELNWTGVFFYDKWFTGEWRKTGDTINMKYDSEVVPQLGNKVIIKNGYFKPVGNSSDSTKFPMPMFYVGYCRGGN